MSSDESVTADVGIIGAGPAGIATALWLSKLGVRNIVLTDRQDFPRDKTCGSGVSPKGIAVLRQLGVWNEVQANSYPVMGLRLVTPEGRELYVSGGESAAAIICSRRILDHTLLRQALSHGVRFIPKFYTTSLLERDGRIEGFKARDGREVVARYTVVADGAHSLFTVDSSRKCTFQAIMGWWEGVAGRPRHVEMVFDPALVPGYGWLFPETEHRVNIGICYEDPAHTRNARALFDEFLHRQYAPRLASAEQIGAWKGHPISYGFRVGRLHSPGRLIVGEAGRMTHPATAEGIYQGMLSGMFAAEALRYTLEGRVGEAAAFRAYEKRCGRAFNLSFQSSKLWRWAVRTPMLDWIAQLSQQPSVRNTVATIMARM